MMNSRLLFILSSIHILFAGNFEVGRVNEIVWGKGAPTYASIIISSITGDDGTVGPFGSTQIYSPCTTVQLDSDDYINYIEKWYGTCYGCGGQREANSYVRAIRIKTNTGKIFTCDEGNGIEKADSYQVYDYTNTPNTYLTGVVSSNPNGDIIDHIDFIFTDVNPTIAPTIMPTQTILNHVCCCLIFISICIEYMFRI